MMSEIADSIEGHFACPHRSVLASTTILMSLPDSTMPYDRTDFE